MLEHEREWAHRHVAHVVLEQLRIGVGNQQADDQNREHIEQQNAPEHLAHGLGDVLGRVFGFTGGDADQLRALKRKAHDHRHADQRGKAARERRIAIGEVGDIAPETLGRAALENAEHHQQTDADEHQHGHDLDGGEPEFRLAETACGQRVQPDHQCQKQRAPEHAVHIGEPVGHDELCGHEVDGDGHRPVVPVVPAEREAESGVHVLGSVGGERAGDGKVRRHLAQAGHQEIHHQPDHHVGQQRAAGTGLRDGCARGDEQAGADGAANGDHGHVSRLERAAKLAGFGCGSGTGCVHGERGGRHGQCCSQSCRGRCVTGRSVCVKPDGKWMRSPRAKGRCGCDCL